MPVRVILVLIERVKGRVVGMPVTERVKGSVVGIPVRVTDTLTERVNGRVVGMPVRVTDTLTERVKGCVVGIPVRVTDTLTERVKGCVVGIPVLEIVAEVVAVPKEEAATVGTDRREVVTVTERLYVKDGVIDLVKGRVVGMPVRVIDTLTERVKARVVGTPVLEIVADVVAVRKEEAATVGTDRREVVTVTERLYVEDGLIERVKARVVGSAVRVIDTLTERVKARVVGAPLPEAVLHMDIDTLRVRDTDTVRVTLLLDAAAVVERVIVTECVREPDTV